MARITVDDCLKKIPNRFQLPAAAQGPSGLMAIAFGKLGTAMRVRMVPETASCTVTVFTY